MERSDIQTWLKEGFSLEEEIPQKLYPVFEELRSRLEAAEQKQAQMSARRYLLKAALNALPNPVFIKDEELRFAFFNKAYKEFFGLEDNEYIGKRVQDLPYLSPEHQQRYHEEDTQAVQELSELQYETQICDKDGTERDSLYWTKGFEIPQNGRRGLVGEIVNISKRKQAQRDLARSIESIHQKDQELRYQTQLFNILVNGTVDIFVMFSAEDYRVEYVSPNIEKLLGLSAEEVKKDIRKISATAIALDGDPLAEQLSAIPEGGSLQILNEHIHQKTGERRWYQKTVYRFRLESADKFILVMSERTQEMETQRQLELSMELIESATKAKSNFLANMSHDIRTPMNAIIGFSNLLNHDAENPQKVRNHARKITSSGQHLLSLINDILDMSKIESGKTALNVAEFNLSELLEDIGAIVAPQAKAKKQKFEIKVHGLDTDRLVGDKTRIDQILMNLLSNSVKYTQEGGDIELHILQVGHAASTHVHIQFQVMDNGMGMSPEYLEVIFDAFTREASSMISSIQGTGLGMAITKNLVELMGGTIDVESEKDKGTKFTVELPLTVAKMDEDKNFWRDCNISKILVVDDEIDICKDIQMVMSKTGVNVSYATDGRTAIRMIEDALAIQDPFELILLDWKMPGMGGVQTARHIREELGNKSPIVILTAYDWSEIEDEANEAGVTAFMPKPFFITNFRHLLQQIKAGNEQTGAAESAGAADISGLRFLVAEDIELNAEIICDLLSLEGASCDIAENGEVALEKFRSSKAGYYDMILMDVQMPVMDGYTAARAIRICDHPDAKTIPIAAMTANAFDEDVRNALDSGMNAHISKPVDMKVLKETAGQLLKKRED